MKCHTKEAFLTSQVSLCVSIMGHWKPDGWVSCQVISPFGLVFRWAKFSLPAVVLKLQEPWLDKEFKTWPLVL